MNERIESIARWFSDAEDERQLRELDTVLCEVDPASCTEEDFHVLLNVFERFSESDGFEVFWSIIHFLEACDGYESSLLRSVERKPVEFNVLMINRLLNSGMHSIDGNELVPLLVRIAGDNRVSPDVREMAAGFVEHHNENPPNKMLEADT